MTCAHPYPFSFSDIKFCAACMHKVKLPEWLLLMQIAISLQGSTTVRARVNYGEAVKVALLVRCGMGFQGFDDEPLVGVGLAYLSPEHVLSLSVVSTRFLARSRPPESAHCSMDRYAAAQFRGGQFDRGRALWPYDTVW
jgi:hypothetical protein